MRFGESASKFLWILVVFFLAQWRFYCFMLALLAAVGWYSFAVTGGTGALSFSITLTAMAVLLPILPTKEAMIIQFEWAVARVDRRFIDGEITREQATEILMEASRNATHWHAIFWPYYWLAAAPKWKRIIGP